MGSSTEQSRQWPQSLAILSASLLAITSGCQIGWPSPSIPKMLTNDLGFELSENEVSYVIMIAPLGYFIGSPLGGFLLDNLGRKYSLISLAIPQIIPLILLITSTNVAMIYAARFLTGVADGALFTVFPAYMGEVAEPKVRGLLGTSQSMGILIGVLLINSYGSYVSIRIGAYISLAIPILFLLTFIWMPESPYYLAMKGRIDDARESLRKLRRMNNVEIELCHILKDVERQLSEPGRVKDIFINSTNLKAFIILLLLRTFQQLSGLSALSFYTQVIFKEVGGVLSPALAAIISCLVQVVVMFFCSGLIDKFGRRPVLIFSSISSALTLFSMGLFFCMQMFDYDVSWFIWTPIVSLTIYNVVCGIGLLTLPNLMAGELLSVSIKSKALGLLNCYFGVCISGSSKLFQSLDHYFGMYAPFFVFAGCCVVSAIVCYFCVPETKGKTLEEIQQILGGKHKKSESTESTNL